MKIKGVFLAAILTAVLCISGNVLAYSGDGDGSAESPYQISIVEDWQELMATPADWTSSFILTADVNLAGVSLTPVGNSSKNFTGVFDGNGNIISNAVINQPGSYYVGLFGYVGSSGQIRNLGVEDVNITGHMYVGGLVGRNEGTLTYCYATGSVTGNYYYVGGLVGENWGSSARIENCYAAGSVTGTGQEVGGLVGYNSSSSTITACFWDKETSGQPTSDGGTGKTTAEMKTLSTFTSAGG